MRRRPLARGLAAALAVVALAPAAGAAPAIADEAGTPVRFTSTRNDTVIYLAKGVVETRASPDPFESVGTAPLEIKLAPGLYTLETGGETQSTGHQVITVDRWPMTVQVRTGDASVRSFGTILIAMGVVAIVAGIVVVATFGKGEGSFNKYEIAIPLLAGGAVASGVGVGMTFLGATNIGAANAPSAPSPRPSGAGVQATLRF